MFPVRCHTCNTVLAHLHEEFRARMKENPSTGAGRVMDDMRVTRMCCRCAFVGYVDVRSNVGQTNLFDEEEGVFLKRRNDDERRCDCS